MLGFCCCTGLSVVAASGSYSLVAVQGLLTASASLIARAWPLGHTDFGSCNFRAQAL